MGASDLQLQRAAFELWLNGEGEDNRADLERLKRVLPVVLEECVTEKQRRYILHYFVDRMAVKEIARLYQLDESTVSRTINRGLDNAYRYLRFVSPAFIKVPRRRGNISNR